MVSAGFSWFRLVSPVFVWLYVYSCVSCRRFQNLVPFTGLKSFTQGITHLSQMNAYEYRDIMKSCVVCFRGVQFSVSYIYT